MENTKVHKYDNIELEDEEELILKNKEEQQNKFTLFLKKFLTHLFLISCTVFIAFSAFSIVSYCWKNDKLQTNVASMYSLNNKNIYYKEMVSEATIDKLDSFVKTLPEGISNIFYNDWIVVVDDEFPQPLSNSIVIVQNNDYDTSDMILGGYTFTQSRVIYINGKLDEQTIYEAFVHEIGHLTSFEYGSQHGSKEWETIYNKGIVTLDVSEYDKSNEAEFFASCFQLYFTEQEKLTIYLNEAVGYFDTLLSQKVRDDNFFAKYIMGYENTINTLRIYLKRGFSS